MSTEKKVTAPMQEWLLTSRTGAFAMGTPSRTPERKYHGLLAIRRPFGQPPLHILAEIAEAIVTPAGRHELGSFRYGEVIHPTGYEALVSFTATPAPRWEYRFEGGVSVVRRLELAPDRDAVRVHYQVNGAPDEALLELAPLFTLRGLHGEAGENDALDRALYETPHGWSFAPYAGLPSVEISVQPSGALRAQGFWNRQVEYAEEARRGYRHHEDLYCPGQVTVAIPGGGFEAIFQVRVEELTRLYAEPPARTGDMNRDATPTSRSALERRLAEAAERFVYLEPHTGEPGLIAGFPWFDDWARDTLISLPGLLLERGELALAARVLDRAAALRVDGLLPRLLASTPADCHEPCADASLWFVRAVELHEQAVAGASAIGPGDTSAPGRWDHPVLEILQAFGAGTAAGMFVREDGMLHVDRRPLASTWMDAEVDGHAITPRAPLAVEIQALFAHALEFGQRLAARQGRRDLCERWLVLGERHRRSFRRLFWNDQRGHLNDSHDDDLPDPSLRPNQLIALALPAAAAALSDDEQRAALATVRAALWTPFGLRTLAPDDPAYLGQCTGTQRERDCAYHQGTVWPWLLGPYLDAVARIEGPAAAHHELDRSLPALRTHLDEGCLGQIAEIFDGDAPHAPRGAPAQAWSVAELLRTVRQHTRFPALATTGR